MADLYHSARSTERPTYETAEYMVNMGRRTL